MDLNWQDISAIIFFIIAWFGYGYYAKRRSFQVDCLASIMHNYRKEWALQIIKRDVRTSDIILIGAHERTASFFASSSLLILVALFTALGSSDSSITFLQKLPFVNQISYLVWEIMLLCLIFIFIYAFFKISWSMRQYGFSLTMIGALPPHNINITHNDKGKLVSPIAKTLSSAAYHFNCGLRAYYFSLAIVAWLIAPWAFIASTTLVVFELHRREFRSRVLKNMLPDR